jgi:hypothetical protein
LENRTGLTSTPGRSQGIGKKVPERIVTDLAHEGRLQAET